MDDRRFERLEGIMERGFAALADLQRETIARLDQVNARLDEANTRLDQVNARPGSDGTHGIVPRPVHPPWSAPAQIASLLREHRRHMRVIAQRYDPAIPKR
ncbi:MAG: hypothetical protein J0L92_11535 [Deltaproteobacteria bacterium]|nr:hypothetical protein [Deltaproteobacteria bacterium]